MTTLAQTIDYARECRPTTPRQVYLWVHRFTGIKIPTMHVCQGHTGPFTMFSRQFLDRPDVATLARTTRIRQVVSIVDRNAHVEPVQPADGNTDPGRLAGEIKPDLSRTHRRNPRRRRSAGVGRRDVRDARSRCDPVQKRIVVKMLAASPTSVRGPHVASLKLDEVDEIKPDIREDAMGTCMEVRGVSSSVPDDLDVAPCRRADGRAARTRSNRAISVLQLLRL